MLKWFSLPISSYSSEERTALHWLIQLRWFALGIQAIAFIAGCEIDLIQGAHRPLFLITIVSLALWNFWTQNQILQRKKGVLHSIAIHLAIDLFEMSLLLSLSGGAENPFINLIFFHTALVALLLKGRNSIYLMCEIVVCIVFLNKIENFYHNWIFILARLITTFAIWQLLTSFARVHSEMREHLERTRDKQLRLDRLRAIGALATGFSHQFATPLNTAKMRLERFFRSHNNECPKDLLIVQESLKHCETALKQLNDVRTNPKAISERPSAIIDIVQENVQTWKANHPSFFVDISIVKNGECTVPSLPFTQMILDLLDNAQKASENHSQNIKIQIHVLPEETELWIIDHGVGWPQLVREKIGEPFITTSSEGSGLGLYHAYSLIHALGGSLTLLDTLGGGATILIKIPFSGYSS